jgi:hypothetical protein
MRMKLGERGRADGTTAADGFTGPVGLTLSVPTVAGASPAFAMAGAAVVVLPYVFRLLPYAYAIYMDRRGRPFTVEDNGVKLSSEAQASTPSLIRLILVHDPRHPGWR